MSRRRRQQLRRSRRARKLCAALDAAIDARNRAMAASAWQANEDMANAYSKAMNKYVRENWPDIAVGST